ncbi:peptidase family M1, partial [Ancylostoma caninum]
QLAFVSSYPHPIVVPDDHRSATSTGEGSFKYNISIKLPDVISVTEYYVTIQPYYPAPNVRFDPGRNMTFDGMVTMSIIVKKTISEFTLNALNLNITSLELRNLLQLPVAVKETKMYKKIHQLTIVFAEPQRAGTVLSLSIKYTGLINSYFDGGLYYTYYMDLKGELHWMVATQLGSFAARAVFPCMDEPAYKAVFHLELIYPSAHVALANMKENKPVDMGNGWSKVTFPPTPVMSTYLVAFTVGPYVSSSVINQDGTLVRAWGWEGQEDFLQYTAETAGKCLYQMRLYTNIKFPMEKCDHLANPQFPAGAMENFGLVIYKYQFVSLNPKTMTTLDKVEATRVICHEVSHQWFGDLVTAQYWDELFMNEGFATYLQRILMARAFPSEASFIEAELIKNERELALKLDASSATHPLITMDGPFFDRITYQKGAMLLRLLSDVIGIEPFRDALQQLLKTYEYSTASHRNLFSCLNDVVHRANVSGWCGPLNVTHLMEPYFHQTSFPVIYVHGDKDGLSLSQEPFNDISTQLPSSWNYKWIIPVRAAHYSSKDTEILWMVPKELENSQQCPLKSVNRWHTASYTTSTYGRIFYDDESLDSLLKKITSGDVPMGVKISLVGDEVALIARHISKGQPYSYDRLLNILVTVFNTPSTDDPSYSLADIALPQFEFFASLLRDTVDAPLINRLFERIFAKIYKAEQWEESSSWNAKSALHS